MFKRLEIHSCKYLLSLMNFIVNKQEKFQSYIFFEYL